MKTNVSGENNRKGKVTCWLIMAAALLFAVYPLLLPGIYEGSDAPFHLGRIESLKDALRSDIFPVKVHPQLAYGYGYGEGFFYSDALLYVPALIRLAGASLETAYKLYAGSLLTGTLVGMFYCTWRITRNVYSSTAAAVLYLLSTRIVGQLYLDFALGSVAGSIFVPFCIAGIYLFLTRDEGMDLFAIGYIGALFTHAISTLLAFVTCLALVVVYSRRLFTNAKKLLEIIAVSVLILMAAASYLIPMLQQYHAQILKVKAPFTIESQNIVSARNLIGSRGIGLGILLSCAAVVVVFFFILIRGTDSQKQKLQQMGTFSFYIIGILEVWITMFQPFWEFINRYTSIIQFPARILAPASCLILFAFAGCLSAFRKPAVKNLLMAGLLLVSCFQVIQLFYVDEIPHRDSRLLKQVVRYEVAGTGAGQEWLPIEVDQDQLKENGDKAVASDGSIVIGSKTDYSRYYTFSADASKDYYDVPFIYYRGYQAADENGSSYEIGKNPENGLVRVYMSGEAGKHHVTVCYVTTRYMQMSYFISLVGWGGLIAFFVRQHRSSKLVVQDDLLR